MRSCWRVALGCAFALMSAACADILGLDEYGPGSSSASAVASSSGAGGSGVGASSSASSGGAGSGGSSEGGSGPLRVFVTSTKHSGMLGADPALAIATADQICRDLAAVALPGRNWVAWLTNEHRLDMAFVLGNFGPWSLTDGTPIAADYLDLVMCRPCLGAPINKDEFGDAPTDNAVWTGTGTDGSNVNVDANQADCNEWTTAAPSVLGANGSRVDFSASWTYVGHTSCNGLLRLYCFEVP